MNAKKIALVLAAGVSVLAVGGSRGPQSRATDTAPAAATAVTVRPALTPAAGFAQLTLAPRLAAAQVVALGAWMPTPSAAARTLKLPASSVRTKPTVPVYRCRPGLRQNIMMPVAVSPGTTSATVTWQDLADPSVLMYRIGAIPQGGPGATGALGQTLSKWQTVPAVHTCDTVTATITGLTSNTPYEFWLDAVHTTTAAYGRGAVPPGTMIGRSSVVIVR